MSLKHLFQPVRLPTSGSLALLFIRAVAGTAFMHHGWGKINEPFSWMGPDSGYPAVVQFFAALSEFGGGFAWIIGALTPLASLGIGITMAVATYTHMILKGDPFVNLDPKGGGAYELPVLFLATALVLLAIGPGRFSIDRAVFGPRALHLKSNDYP
jgi:putative oxidoreductase